MNEMMKNNMWFKTAFLTFVFCALGFVESRADIQLTDGFDSCCGVSDYDRRDSVGRQRAR